MICIDTWIENHPYRLGLEAFFSDGTATLAEVLGDDSALLRVSASFHRANYKY